MSHSRKSPYRRLLPAAIEQLEARSMMSVNPVGAPPAPLLPAESIDGTGNNVAHPTWGSTGQDLLRLSPVAYGDGISTPSGADRPGARLVSNLLAASPEGGVTNDRDFTAFVYAWGQFLDHDLGLTDTATPRERLPIPVPTGDPSFDPNSTGAMTISMARSAWDAATGTGTNNPRQQVNSITAFIDGSQVYGSDATRAAALREFTGGRLRTSTGNLMPFNTSGLANANDAHVVADNQLFLAGDVRANENPELVALQTLFVREHNRIATEAAAKNPTWTDEQLYQHARRIVIAELQKITYDEFLPAILGANTPAANALRDVQKTSLVDIIRRNTQLTNLQPDVFFFRTSIGGNIFADGNRDGVRQRQERGVAGTTVALVTSAGATVATTRSDARGDYSFRGIDLGSFRVVVTPPAGAGQTGEGVKSRVVAITRGMDVRDVNVGLPPKPAAPAAKPPVSQPPARSPLAAAFAGIAASQPTAQAPTKPRR